MIALSPDAIADAMRARIVGRGPDRAPVRAVVDSRSAGAGDLFFGLQGENSDGGRFAGAAFGDGAWGVVVSDQWATEVEGPGWVFAVAEPLLALQNLATAWRHELGADVVGITGSVGKTSVKDIARALLPGRVHASEQNLNTEIGLPLTVLAAEPGTETLVLEMAMRGAGQIAELADIAEPDVGVITNVGPVHVELLGSIEGVAAAKAELIRGIREGGTLVVPTHAGALDPHLLGGAPSLIRFGEGGDVRVVEAEAAHGVTQAQVMTPAGTQEFSFPFAEAHNLTNALAAIAVGVALGAPLAEMADGAADIGFSRFRGERLDLGDGITLVNDCYNANPVSMRAALDHLATLESGQRFAVLGLMAELGPDTDRYHREVGRHARDLGIDTIIGVGEIARGYEPDELVADPDEAAELLAASLEPGDTVLVKGSRSAGLEAVAEALLDRVGSDGGDA